MSAQTCEHLVAHTQQASASVDGVLMCAVCASESLIELDSPDAAAKVWFTECGHQRGAYRGKPCGICRTSVLGALLFQYGAVRLDTKGSNPKANRIARLIGSMVRAHGLPHILVPFVNADSAPVR